jgi:hypothetical protein
MRWKDGRILILRPKQTISSVCDAGADEEEIKFIQTLLK